MIVPRTLLLVCVGVVASVLAGTVLIVQHVFSPADVFALTNAEQEEYWKTAIEEKGADAAYKTFSKSVANLSYAQQHVQAHVFGGVLYATLGTDGLAVCDSQFSFGCFHEFLGRAIADLGVVSVPELNQACIDSLGSNALSCQHGIGHGVQSYFGYDREHLEESLAVCSDLPFSDPIGGCYGGAFMEYNVRTMLADQATAREFGTSELDPCDSLERPEYTRACIYWQPQWWHAALFSSGLTEREYIIMGSYCDAFAEDNEVLQRSCYEGIGNITAFAAGFDPERAKVLCDVTSRDPIKQLFCRSIVANHLGIDVSIEIGERMCNDYAEKTKEYCLAYARNEANIAQELFLQNL